MNNTIHNTQDSSVNMLPTDNLTQPLQSAAVYPMEHSKKAKLATGNRWCKLIKKGELSKLPQSVCVEVPASLNVAEYMQQATIAAAVKDYIVSLQDAQIKALIVVGAQQVQYSQLNAASLDTFLATSDESGRIGQLSAERITGWFESDARELLLVALAERLGITETATPEEVVRLEQIANQTRDNLAKLASKKPVQFDSRVKAALEWALSVTDTGDNITTRLQDKLSAPEQVDMLASLGF